MGTGGARTSLKRMEGTRKEGARRETQARKQGAGWPWGLVRRRRREPAGGRGRARDCARAGERRAEVAEVELMHAPGHAPKPLTGSQPTSLYDKYKRRAQRLLLIAWQKLRNPHFVLRTPDSYRRASTSLLSLSFSFSSSFLFSFPRSSCLSLCSGKK